MTQDHSTFPLRPDGEACANFDEVLYFYKLAALQRSLSGPTSYAPMIHKAIDIVEESNQYHILVIIADGQFVTKDIPSEHCCGWCRRWTVGYTPSV